MGRPRLPEGSRVVDQLHAGVRFEPEIKGALLAVLAHANAKKARKGGMPDVTLSGLVKTWVRERLALEFDRILVEEPHTTKEIVEAHGFPLDFVVHELALTATPREPSLRIAAVELPPSAFKAKKSAKPRGRRS